MQDEIIKVKSGRHKGLDYRVEAPLSKMPGSNHLPDLVSQGNWAAHNAIEIDKYTIADEPFYYGKIDGLGYIISAKDLGKIK